MNKFVKETYLPALRNGKHRKTRLRLYEKGAVCALGVAGRCLKIPVKELNNQHEDTYDKIKNALGLKELWTIWSLNDDEGKTFPEIADYLETHPELFID